MHCFSSGNQNWSDLEALNEVSMISHRLVDEHSLKSRLLGA